MKVDTDGISLLHVQKIDCFCVNLTNKCNLSCIYCEHRSDDLANKSDYKDDELLLNDLFLKKMRKYTNTIQMAGSGEPTLHKRYTEIIEKACAQNFNTIFVTNLSKKLSHQEVISLSMLSRLTVSLDAIDEKILVETRINADLKQIFSNIVQIKTMAYKYGNQNIEIYFNCVVHDKNIMLIEDLAYACISMGLNGIYFNDLIIYPVVSKQRGINIHNAYTKEIKNCSERLRNTSSLLTMHKKDHFFMPVLQSVHDDHYEEIYKKNDIYYTGITEGTTRDCLLPWSTLVGTKYGIAPCCGNFHWSADLLNDNFLELLNSNNYLELRKQLLTGKLCNSCKTCSYAGTISIPAFQDKVKKSLASGIVDTWKRWHIQES